MIVHNYFNWEMHYIMHQMSQFLTTATMYKDSPAVDSFLYSIRNRNKSAGTT